MIDSVRGGFRHQVYNIGKDLTAYGPLPANYLQVVLLSAADCVCPFDLILSCLILPQLVKQLLIPPELWTCKEPLQITGLPIKKK